MTVRGVLNLKIITAEQMAALTRENAVYCGRRPVRKWKGRKAAPPADWLVADVNLGSVWGNQFYARPDPVADYAEWLWSAAGRRDRAWSDLYLLHDRWLLCWCVPDDCHCHVIAAAVEGKRWTRAGEGKEERA